MDLKPLKLRPHHGMCIPFFSGHGYSGEFVESLSRIRERLDSSPEQKVVLWNGTDRVCAACPENQNGVCRSAEKVSSYDKKCLQACGLTFGEVLSWDRFRSLVKQRILLQPSVRTGICSDCLWNSLCRQQDADQ
jgi:hypothetical protein